MCARGRVTELKLPNNELKGTIPDLSDLTSLITLDLHGNKISGSLPSLAFAANLSFVWLNKNFISGVRADGL